MNFEKGITIQKEDTVLNADTVEWCPYPDHQQILLCGTYKLLEDSFSDHAKDESVSTCEAAGSGPDANGSVKVEHFSPAPQVRLGDVITYKILFPDSSQPQLQECGKVSMSGVLDIKWSNAAVGNKLVYGIVDADGKFQMYQLKEEDYASVCLAMGHLSESSLGLSLDWTGHSHGMPLVAASDSAGYITVFQISDSVSCLSSWQAHDYEAWITAFHKFDNNVVYSGGDDCKLKSWDLRNTTQPTFCSSRHVMGVCSIQSHPFDEHIFASGSYDEELMVWDRRKLKQPMSSTSLGGGVWRIKWDPFSGSKILTATMYNGTHIVDCADLGQSSMSIVARYDDHNLAYGADWCRLCPDGTSRSCRESSDTCGTNCDLLENQDTFLISTCSFYDHSLHLWKWSSPVK